MEKYVRTVTLGHWFRPQTSLNAAAFKVSFYLLGGFFLPTPTRLCCKPRALMRFTLQRVKALLESRLSLPKQSSSHAVRYSPETHLLDGIMSTLSFEGFILSRKPPFLAIVISSAQKGCALLRIWSLWIFFLVPRNQLPDSHPLTRFSQSPQSMETTD